MGVGLSELGDLSTTSQFSQTYVLFTLRVVKIVIRPNAN